MRRLGAAAALAGLVGCTVGPNYGGPPAVAPVASARGSFVRVDPGVTPAPGLARWWETLGDPILTRLVDDALAHSPTIDVAAARVRQAEARLRERSSRALPRLSASASELHAELPGVDLGLGRAGQNANGGTSLDFVNVGVAALWEPDLFGGAKRATEQATAQIGQGFAALSDAQVSLSAKVATTYVSFRGAQARAEADQAAVDLQRRALGLMRSRLGAGAASSLDVERLQTDLDSAEARQADLSAEIDANRDRLAMLTGREPGTLDEALASMAPIPVPPASVPVGDPAAVISRRPDVRAAERALAAANAGIGVQRARQFPSVRFFGVLGLGGAASRPLDVSALLAPTLDWSFLDFGRNRAAIAGSEAQRDEAAARYRETVLMALQDAETSLTRFGAARRQFADLLRVEASADRAASLNAQRTAAGTSSTIDQLDIERQRLAAKTDVVRARANLTASYIAVQKALGLGWSDQERSAADAGSR